jgi:hypothetical protein
VFDVQPYLVQMRCVAAVGGLEVEGCVLVGGSRQTGEGDVSCDSGTASGKVVAEGVWCSSQWAGVR